ncbi:MAG: 2-amino-4-hydroxy-6-hydroxymethyldihydropteridine diphosphokinase [Actinobacteria bacterium]|nr:MAG: 2-amino-4-hydroxy-6-hydroxymethyldihydropteridine diphosphokinase [Actinomycetota bacterium]
MISTSDKVRRLHATIGFGSNLGDSAASIQAAVGCLAARADTTLISVSHLYRTPPWGETDQPWFLNACALIATTLSPIELLKACKKCESKIGRQASYRWGPREIDIDILTYADENIDSESLTIPHRELLNRAFVLIPLAEIASELVPAGGGTTIGEAAATIDRTGVEKWEPICSNHG